MRPFTGRVMPRTNKLLGTEDVDPTNVTTIEKQTTKETFQVVDPAITLQPKDTVT